MKIDQIVPKIFHMIAKWEDRTSLKMGRRRQSVELRRPTVDVDRKAAICVSSTIEEILADIRRVCPFADEIEAVNHSNVLQEFRRKTIHNHFQFSTPSRFFSFKDISPMAQRQFTQMRQLLWDCLCLCLNPSLSWLIDIRVIKSRDKSPSAGDRLSKSEISSLTEYVLKKLSSSPQIVTTVPLNFFSIYSRFHSPDSLWKCDTAPLKSSQYFPSISSSSIPGFTHATGSETAPLVVPRRAEFTESSVESEALTVEHFILASATQCALASEIDWDAIGLFAEEDIVQCLRGSAEFASAINLREQYFHACKILHFQHCPAVPFLIIGRFFNVRKATIHWHYRQYFDQMTEHCTNRRSANRSQEERDDFVQRITEAYANL
jgi:hypothetical protein